MNTKLLALAATMGALTVGATAMPTLLFTGVGNGGNVKITTNGGGSYRDVFSGELNMRFEEGSTRRNFFGFCTSPEVNMAGSAYGVTVSDTTNLTPNGDRIAHLANTYAFTIRDNGLADDARALQLVIWELVSETSGIFDVTNGSFVALETNGSALNSSTLAKVNAFLSDSGVSVAPWYQAALGDGGKMSQDIVEPVPEPATLAALGLGLAALRRRRKANA